MYVTEINGDAVPVLKSSVAYVDIAARGYWTRVYTVDGNVATDTRDTRSKALPKLLKAGYVRTDTLTGDEIYIHPDRIVWDLVPPPAKFCPEDFSESLPLGTGDRYVLVAVRLLELYRLMSCLADSGIREARDWISRAQTRIVIKNRNAFEKRDIGDIGIVEANVDRLMVRCLDRKGSPAINEPTRIPYSSGKALFGLIRLTYLKSSTWINFRQVNEAGSLSTLYRGMHPRAPEYLTLLFGTDRQVLNDVTVTREEFDRARKRGMSGKQLLDEEIDYMYSGPYAGEACELVVSESGRGSGVIPYVGMTASLADGMGLFPVPPTYQINLRNVDWERTVKASPVRCGAANCKYGIVFRDGQVLSLSPLAYKSVVSEGRRRGMEVPEFDSEGKITMPNGVYDVNDIFIMEDDYGFVIMNDGESGSMNGTIWHEAARHAIPGSFQEFDLCGFGKDWADKRIVVNVRHLDREKSEKAWAAVPDQDIKWEKLEKGYRLFSRGGACSRKFVRSLEGREWKVRKDG